MGSEDDGAVRHKWVLVSRHGGKLCFTPPTWPHGFRYLTRDSARCGPQHPPGQAVPAAGCRCGFWSAADQEGAGPSPAPGGMLAEVRCSGTTAEADDGGRRAEHQEVLSVAVPDRCRRCGRTAVGLAPSNWAVQVLSPVCSRHTGGGELVAFDALGAALGVEVRTGTGTDQALPQLWPLTAGVLAAVALVGLVVGSITSGAGALVGALAVAVLGAAAAGVLLPLRSAFGARAERRWWRRVLGVVACVAVAAGAVGLGTAVATEQVAVRQQGAGRLEAAARRWEDRARTSYRSVRATHPGADAPELAWRLAADLELSAGAAGVRVEGADRGAVTLTLLEVEDGATGWASCVRVEVEADGSVRAEAAGPPLGVRVVGACLPPATSTTLPSGG